MPTRLHLGCGTRYLDGYVNIDHPPSQHTVQSDIRVDRHADIVKLTYPAGSVDEIRLHHVFEHFPRQIALALVCRWNDWLKPGGLLWIETPDVMTSAWALVSPFTSEDTRQQILRHLFGSHEAQWAAHWDGWYESRFAATLTLLRFRDLEFVHSAWGALRNIEVKAHRGAGTYSAETYRPIVRELLMKSLVTHKTKSSRHAISESELCMLEVWMREWEAHYLAQEEHT